MSDAIEVAQDRAASRAVLRSAERLRHPSEAPHDGTFAIWQDQLEMSIIVYHVAGLVAHYAFRPGAEGRIFAEAVARRVDAVDLVTMRVVRPGE